MFVSFLCGVILFEVESSGRVLIVGGSIAGMMVLVVLASDEKGINLKVFMHCRTHSRDFDSYVSESYSSYRDVGKELIVFEDLVM